MTLGRGISPSQGRYLHTNTEQTQESMPLVGFKPLIPIFKWEKTISCLREHGYNDRPVLTEDLCLVQKEEFSITRCMCYM
jgi:hypothetical protein